MYDLQWYDYLRLVIATCALIALYRLGYLYKLRGDGWSPRLRDIAWVFAGYLFITIAGMLEQVADDIPWGYRTILTFVISIVAIRATRYSDEPLQKL